MTGVGEIGLNMRLIGISFTISLEAFFRIKVSGESKKYIGMSGHRALALAVRRRGKVQ
jgi:hypothetical protein